MARTHTQCHDKMPEMFIQSRYIFTSWPVGDDLL